MRLVDRGVGIRISRGIGVGNGDAPERLPRHHAGLLAAFQPHLFSRTRDLAPEFGVALAAADLVFLTEIYPAREQPIPGVTSELIVRAMQEARAPLQWRGDRRQLAGALAAAVRAGDVVFTLGAGDITRTGPELLAMLGRGT